MMNVFGRFDIQPKFDVPRRFSEGYVLSREITAHFFEDRIPNVVLAFDCGTNAVPDVDLSKSKGCDVFVVDHHKAKSSKR
jgi:single-stranded DNA-specific DHH superfamily exonuclease